MTRTPLRAASCRFSILLVTFVLTAWARNVAAEQPEVSTPNESVKGQPAKVEGLAVTPVKITANVLGCMFWADKEGTAFWAVDGSGVIYNVSFPDLTITQKIDLVRDLLMAGALGPRFSGQHAGDQGDLAAQPPHLCREEEDRPALQ